MAGTVLVFTSGDGDREEEGEEEEEIDIKHKYVWYNPCPSSNYKRRRGNNREIC